MEVAAGGVDEKFRCRRTGDRGLWRCKLQAMSGRVLCQKHWLEYERMKEKKKMERLNKLRNKENGDGSNSGDVVGNEMATGTEKNRVCDGVGTSEGQGAVIPVESGGEGVGAVKEKELETPKGSKDRNKITVENDVEAMQMGGDAGGDCSGVRGKKRGRPKGSKNRKKSSVWNDVGAMQMGKSHFLKPLERTYWTRKRSEGVRQPLTGQRMSDIRRPHAAKNPYISSEGGGVVGGKKRGIPMNSENHMKTAAENEVVTAKVGDCSSKYDDEVVVKKGDGKNVVAMPVGDVSSEFDEGIVAKKDDGGVKIVGVCERGEALGTTGLMRPVGNGDNFQPLLGNLNQFDDFLF